MTVTHFPLNYNITILVDIIFLYYYHNIYMLKEKSQYMSTQRLLIIDINFYNKLTFLVGTILFISKINTVLLHNEKLLKLEKIINFPIFR